MICKEKINRINALAHKSKSEGLTPEEKAEQKELRNEYIAAVKERTREHLDNIRFIEDMSEEEQALYKKKHC